MKIIGIICEYNPFHNGHLYHLQRTRSIYAPDYIVCIMSGSFTQRGTAAIIDRYTRAKWAIEAGADIVLELPGASSCLDGESFAIAGINTATLIGCTHISFGTETANITEIIKVAKILEDNSADFSTNIKLHLSSGVTYPKALSLAMQSIYPDKNYSKLLDTPNNTLAILYARAIIKGKFNIEPIAILRSDYGYHSTIPCDSFLSASGIRKNIADSSSYLPNYVYNSVKNIDMKYLNFNQDILTLYKLKTSTEETLKNIYDMREGLEMLILNKLIISESLEELLANIKSKRYTMARLKRILTYALLDITPQIAQLSKTFPYARVLAAKSSAKILLNKYTICRYKDLINEESKILWNFEEKAAGIRDLISGTISHSNCIFFD